MEHLSIDELARFRAGALSGTELLDAGDHIAACRECRDRLQGMPAAAGWAEIASSLRASSAASEAHASFEQLRACVDGTMSAAERMRLETHLLECDSCREELEDLRSFAATAVNPSSSPKWRKYLIAGPIAAALLVGIFLMMRTRQPQPQPAPPLAISLHDGGRTLGLDSGGNLVGVPGLAGGDALIAALREGKIPVELPQGLRSNKSVLLGAEDHEQRFHVLGPVGEPVLKDAPEFRWEALPHAKSYQVQIFDSEYRPVASSPEISVTSWTPEKPLDRGKVYAWQVTAIGAGAPVKAPQPPDPEARFLVVPAAEAQQIESARQASAGHLQMAVAFAHAGLCRDALGELDALQQENAASPLARQLRESVAGQCAAH